MFPADGSHYISLFTSRKENEFWAKFFAVFHEYLKVMIAVPSYNDELYGFSAVKVKLVDSLI